MKEPEQLSRYSDGLRVERPTFDFRQGQEIFLYFTVSRPTLGPTQPSIQWVELTGGEAEHSPPSSAKVKNGSAISPLPHTSSRRGT
jgi:hypothetical protein